MNAHHYGLTVSEMATALEFYRDKLGFEELHRADIGPERLGEVVGVDGAEADMTFLDANGLVLELFEYRPAADPIYDGKQQSNAVGAHHLAFEVEDADVTYERLSEEVEFVRPPQTGGTGAYVAYMYDPDGNVVEIVDRGSMDFLWEE